MLTSKGRQLTVKTTAISTKIMSVRPYLLEITKLDDFSLIIVCETLNEKGI